MADLIDRQAAIDAIWDGTNYDIYTREVKEILEEIPSAQPEVKSIDYRDCSCALLKMWIENVLTDSEYSRIQGKLNSSDFAKEGLRVPVSYQEEQDG